MWKWCDFSRGLVFCVHWDNTTGGHHRIDASSGNLTIRSLLGGFDRFRSIERRYWVFPWSTSPTFDPFSNWRFRWECLGKFSAWKRVLPRSATAFGISDSDSLNLEFLKVIFSLEFLQLFWSHVIVDLR